MQGPPDGTCWIESRIEQDAGPAFPSGARVALPQQGSGRSLLGQVDEDGLVRMRTDTTSPDMKVRRATSQMAARGPIASAQMAARRVGYTRAVPRPSNTAPAAKPENCDDTTVSAIPAACTHIPEAMSHLRPM